MLHAVIYAARSLNPRRGEPQSVTSQQRTSPRASTAANASTGGARSNMRIIQVQDLRRPTSVQGQGRASLQGQQADLNMNHALAVAGPVLAGIAGMATTFIGVGDEAGVWASGAAALDGGHAQGGAGGHGLPALPQAQLRQVLRQGAGGDRGVPG
jgi:hypothetical protein